MNEVYYIALVYEGRVLIKVVMRESLESMKFTITEMLEYSAISGQDLRIQVHQVDNATGGILGSSDDPHHFEREFQKNPCIIHPLLLSL